MGKLSRNKGSREERAIIRFLQKKGFAAEKISRTGHIGADLSVPILNVDRLAEVKCRADGFRELYKWLEARDLLIVRADRREPLVVLPLKLAAEIAAKRDRRFGPTAEVDARSDLNHPWT